MLSESAEQQVIEELWRESSRKVAERQRRENCAVRYAHHLKMCDIHAGLAREHEEKAMKLLEVEE